MQELTPNLFIKQHKYICYCEAIILPTGKITYAEPSHVESLITVYMQKYNCSRDQVWKDMPIDAAPIYWLVDKLNVVSVWYNTCVCSVKCTKRQMQTLRLLLHSNTIHLDSIDNCIVTGDAKLLPDRSNAEEIYCSKKEKQIELQKYLF